MTPAEELKAAAEKIRHVAVFAAKGPWVVELLGEGTTHPGYPQRITNAGATVIAETFTAPEIWAVEAEHIAFWDPATALLVADLLDGMAAHWETRPIGDLDIYLATPLCKLARHILGGAQ